MADGSVLDNISPQEVERIKSLFKAADTDNSGTISFKEGHVILNKELGFTEETSQRFMKAFDTNNDGHLDYEEFIVFYFKVKEQISKMKGLFDEFDQDGNGFITQNEAVEILGGMFSEREVKDLVKLHDKNGDGKLDFSEFCKFWNF